MLVPVHSRKAFRDGECSVNTYVWGVGFIMSSIWLFFAASTSPKVQRLAISSIFSHGSKYSEQITQRQSLMFQYRSLRFQIIESSRFCSSIREACRNKRSYPIALLLDLPLHDLVHRQHIHHRGSGRSEAGLELWLRIADACRLAHTAIQALRQKEI